MRSILALSLFFGGVVAGCSSSTDREMPMSDEKSVTLDPVCGIEVDALTAAYREDDGDKTYYFASQDCWQKFHDNPHAYQPGSDDRKLKEVR